MPNTVESPVFVSIHIRLIRHMAAFAGLRCINAWLQFHEECEIEKTRKNQLKINNTLYDFHFWMSC